MNKTLIIGAVIIILGGVGWAIASQLNTQDSMMKDDTMMQKTDDSMMKDASTTDGDTMMKAEGDAMMKQ